MHLSDFGGKYDGHDDSIDGNDLAKNDRDQVLGSYSGSLDATTQYGGTGDENAPTVSVSVLLL